MPTAKLKVDQPSAKGSPVILNGVGPTVTALGLAYRRVWFNNEIGERDRTGRRINFLGGPQIHRVFKAVEGDYNKLSPFGTSYEKLNGERGRGSVTRRMDLGRSKGCEWWSRKFKAKAKQLLRSGAGDPWTTSAERRIWNFDPAGGCEVHEVSLILGRSKHSPTPTGRRKPKLPKPTGEGPGAPGVRCPRSLSGKELISARTHVHPTHPRSGSDKEAGRRRWEANQKKNERW
ncbi:hypothetical protein DFH07DRAFT_766812 [Mycena maculata]|uniref:Uncharacterized protein n=1 Tax=Mycena maculata TaxID=230809 RepID=A0AAD7K270_9AGAR|nr:hypothetical protein DFH07DRAFT_766812 [Mycena maculata]